MGRRKVRVRNISCSLTTPQVRARTKTVTRRLGWEFLKVGDRLQLCEKCMGRRKGEPLVRLAKVEVVDVRREFLAEMMVRPDYGKEECAKEGFPQMTPEEFCEFFVQSHGGSPKTSYTSTVTRIEWRYLD